MKARVKVGWIDARSWKRKKLPRKAEGEEEDRSLMTIVAKRKPAAETQLPPRARERAARRCRIALSARRRGQEESAAISSRAKSCPTDRPDPFCRRPRWNVVVPDVAAKLPGRGLWVASTQGRASRPPSKRSSSPAPPRPSDCHRRSGGARRSGAGDADAGRSGDRARAPANWCWASTMCCARWKVPSRPKC